MSHIQQAENRIQQAEKTYIATQETIVKEYETPSQNYNNILEAFTTLGCNVCMAQVKQDKRHLNIKQTISSMMHILVGIHQNPALKPMMGMEPLVGILLKAARPLNKQVVE
jgi:hypothetical protein